MRALGWALPALLASLAAAEAPDRGTIMVTLGDGSTLPLRAWSLSYEYVASPPGTSPLGATPVRKESADLLVGKRTLPTAGQTLTFTYVEVPRALVKAGAAAATDRLNHVREMVLTGPGGKSTHKPEPPARDLLISPSEKGLTVVARSLDLRGQTVTGTSKEYCLVSYTATVECGGSPADHVVKIEFPE